MQLESKQNNPPQTNKASKSHWIQRHLAQILASKQPRTIRRSLSAQRIGSLMKPSIITTLDQNSLMGAWLKESAGNRLDQELIQYIEICITTLMKEPALFHQIITIEYVKKQRKNDENGLRQIAEICLVDASLIHHPPHYLNETYRNIGKSCCSRIRAASSVSNGCTRAGEAP